MFLSFVVGSFVIPSRSPLADTFLDVSGGGFRKGVAFVNGFNLGRYWPVKGPQVTLYVPAPLLHAASAESAVADESQHANANPNHLWLFELEASSTHADAPGDGDGDGPAPHAARVQGPSMAHFSAQLVDKPLLARPVRDPIPGLECIDLDRDLDNAPDFDMYLRHAEKQRLMLKANQPLPAF